MITHRFCLVLACIISFVSLVSEAGLAQAAPDPSTLGEYVFSTPEGWTAMQYPDGITLTSPAGATGEKCLIQMWPMRQGGPDLRTDANTIFQQVFRGYQPRNRTDRGGDLPPSLIRGVSGQGWEY